jgi:hypothetical protein
MRATFADELEHNIYSRFTNPNVAELAEKLRIMEGGEAGHAVASGHVRGVRDVRGAALGGRSHRGVPLGVRLDAHGAHEDAPALRDRAHVRRRLGRPGDLGGGRDRGHAHDLRRDAHEPGARDPRPRRPRRARRPARPRPRGRQLLRHAGAAAPPRPGGAPLGPLRHEVHRRTGAGARRSGRRPQGPGGRDLRVLSLDRPGAVALQRVGPLQEPGDPRRSVWSATPTTRSRWPKRWTA